MDNLCFCFGVFFHFRFRVFVCLVSLVSCFGSNGYDDSDGFMLWRRKAGYIEDGEEQDDLILFPVDITITQDSKRKYVSLLLLALAFIEHILLVTRIGKHPRPSEGNIGSFRTLMKNSNDGGVSLMKPEKRSTWEGNIVVLQGNGKVLGEVG
ncbi:hypothetical protein L6452_41018 [Arctium lappa]|uniref:Uncharacterized protein n=1 Tax=Arctium lappa TaxID=4217 RepID=A0ACB8XMP7_ARCLA|nr:hypothetical protein L6452_41018 [Arctium lappa]